MNAVADLQRAFELERALVADLRRALLAQRDAVATDDTAEVDASVAVIGRTLLVLDEARRRRTAILALATGHRVQTLAEFEREPGVPADLLASAGSLRSEAEAVMRDVRINQHILRGALDAADAFLQQLFAAIDPTPVYQGSGRPEGHLPGRILNATA